MERQRYSLERSSPLRLSLVGNAPSTIADPPISANQVEEDAEKSSEQISKGWTLWSVIIALLLCVFCVALDETIIATITPHITDQFQAIGDVGWYGSAYLITICSMQMIYGKLYKMFNIKVVYLGALSLFEIGSLIAGVSRSSAMLIAGRGIAGSGAAGITSGALNVIARIMPLHQRPIFASLIGATYGIAAVIGPLMGGALADRATWRWCFYINLPIGGCAATVIILFLRLQENKSSTKAASSVGSKTARCVGVIKELDIVGSSLFLGSIICILLALQWGNSTMPWSDGRIIALLVLFGALLLAFVADQVFQGEHATLPIRIASQRSIAFGFLYALCQGAAFYQIVYFLPIWFQAVRGVSALQSGIDYLPLLLINVFGIIVSGALTKVVGYYMPWIYLSVIFMSVGSGLLYTLTPHTRLDQLVGYQIIFGLGTGLGFQQTYVAAQTVLKPADIPTGTAIELFGQLFGGALFVSVGNNLWVQYAARAVQQLHVPGLDSQSALQAGIGNLANIVPPAYLASVRQAYSDALQQTFRVTLIMSCLSFIGAAGMQWVSVKRRE